jgi:hypothetical protein
VGFGDGTNVGFKVGSNVGFPVGFPVGLAVGFLVGLAVGFLVGFPVAACDSIAPVAAKTRTRTSRAAYIFFLQILIVKLTTY